MLKGDDKAVKADEGVLRGPHKNPMVDTKSINLLLF